jgi:hypothetical protein
LALSHKFVDGSYVIKVKLRISIVAKKETCLSQIYKQRKRRRMNYTFIHVLYTFTAALVASPPRHFVNRELGVVLELERKSSTLVTRTSILGLVEDLFETKFSIVFSIPSITYINTNIFIIIASVCFGEKEIKIIQE